MNLVLLIRSPLRKKNQIHQKHFGFQLTFEQLDYHFHYLYKHHLHEYLHNALYFFLSCFLIAFNSGKVLQPPSIANSLKASLVPEVGGGPNTSILILGKLGSMSDHFVLKLSTNFHLLYSLQVSFYQVLKIIVF